MSNNLIYKQKKEGLSNTFETSLDVRTPEEYASGHIPESINIPVDKIGRLTDTVRDKNTEIYVYCRSGARSHRAAYDLKRLGYKNAVNIGGILSYKGLLER